ncbi:tRNA(Ile)-lysidine synthase [Candida viswanathii]|uniref:tRNA(Ile)-lysidine synthetase n=1 Tax=Candida viswanathii TaxID=5486 RepID=A0A367YQ57_9ASCO|nr:tRNA(Ile)-lysidine synthase [Candida viswanathii]
MIITDELFRIALAKLFRSGIPAKVAVALSGGPDSMLLAWLLRNQKRRNNNLDIYAITIDHKYRPESHREAWRVHEWVKGWDINHIVKALEYKDNLDPSTMNNFEEVARDERYKVMSEICSRESIPALFMGHHRDDQLETFIQRLQGNSSIFGLAGTRSISPLPVARDLSPAESPAQGRLQLQIARPFWEFDKADILETCEASGIPYVTDPTNKDASLTRRNYLRYLIGEVIPNMCATLHTDGSTDGIDLTSPYSSIQRSELIKLHASCHEFATLFEDKAQRLSQYLHSHDLVKEYPHLGSLELTLPRPCFQETDCMVTSRFLYRILHLYSTLKHYHWAYAKLERQLVPRIAQFLEQHKPGTLKITMMNLVFEVTNNDQLDLIPMKIYRCPIVTKNAGAIEKQLSLGVEWSEWELFDSRFWIRARSRTSPKQIRIIPYLHKIHKPMVEELLLAAFRPNAKYNTLPVFLEEDTQKIIAFPTLSIGLPDIGLEYEWSLKSNRFAYCEQPSTV